MIPVITICVALSIVGFLANYNLRRKSDALSPTMRKICRILVTILPFALLTLFITIVYIVIIAFSIDTTQPDIPPEW